MFAGKKSAQIREILISESAWEEMTCLFAPSLNLPGMGSGVLEDIMSIPDSSLRKRLGYEVLSFSLQAHSLSQECIDKLDIFFADDLFKYESVCIAAMEHLKSKATAPIQNGPLPA